MPAPDRNQWVEMWQAAKERREAAAVQLRQWCDAVREEPALFWQTAAVRYTAYGLGGLIVVLLVRAGVGLLQPAPSGRFQPRAKTAMFDVICSSPACGRHFVIERKFNFHAFPVTCPYCKMKSGERALRCHSAHCRGKLVITVEQDGVIYCAECDAVLGRR